MASETGAFRQDIEKCYRIHLGTTTPSFLPKLKLWLVHFGLHCVTVYRFGQFARRLKRKNILIGLPVFIVQRILNFLMRLTHHVDVDDATIGPGFYIGHVGTIFVGPSNIGRNFSIHHNVTIGIGHARTAEGVPTIGDNVWVGAGSMVAGAFTVGDNVTIANGCMLSRNVPAGCLVVGNPGRVVMKDYDNAELFGLPPREKPQPAPEEE
jgi:serine O-acetyltransferase